MSRSVLATVALQLGPDARMRCLSSGDHRFERQVCVVERCAVVDAGLLLASSLVCG